MKNLKLLLITLTVLIASCSRDHWPPKEPVTIKFTKPNLFPEGVVYDPFNKYFLVGSTAEGDIGKVTFDGTYTPYITDDALVSTVGLEIDKNRKRLLAANNNTMANISQLAVYNLNNRERIRLVNLSALLPGSPHFANDIAVDKAGNAYVTDSRSPVIYKVDTDGNASIFFNNAAFATAPGETGFNGIEYHPDGFLLVNFSIRNQVVKIPLKKGAYSIVNLNTPLSRPDGLLISEDGKQLIVVNNAGGTADGRVIAFKSNDNWESGTATDTYMTGPVFPTTATSDGKQVYVLYAYLHTRGQGGTQNVFTIQEVPLSKSHGF